ncbi:MAG: hypothetical protein F6K31_38265 [Symploca sp. SIO2G7]|nr:hypothetical protein [Symploca sp. SIO2G7]
MFESFVWQGFPIPNSQFPIPNSQFSNTPRAIARIFTHPLWHWHLASE